jgi:Holliday junction resolvase RusA-like endonuclease
MTDELRFFVPAKFPSLNELIGAANHNRFDGGRMKKKYTAIAESCARRAAIETGWMAPEGPVSIAITWVERDRRRDQDNVTAGQKYLLDGIVAAGVLLDDSQRYVPQPSTNEITFDKNRPGVWVTIRRSE